MAKMDLYSIVEHGYADNNGVRIHYVTIGQGPLIVMLHGFPDFWYTWRNQMEVLSDKFKVVAMDLRGFNRSDKPEGVRDYEMKELVSDVVAVVRHLNHDEAIIAGHDWGGWVSWYLAMWHPERVEKLIVLNLPHPRGLARELANNPEQQQNVQYARNFQQRDWHRKLTSQRLARWVSDPQAKERYIEAFDRSGFAALLNYYKANYPREPYKEDFSPLVKVKCPVLLMHGLKDVALLPGMLNDTWKWVEKELFLVTVPYAGHFIQHDAPEFVSRIMKMWLEC